MGLHYFDRKAEYAVVERRLPHWTQPGVVCFITFRRHDSMPKEVVQRWRDERDSWLRKHGVDPETLNWSAQLRTLDKVTQNDFYRTFSMRWHVHLLASFFDEAAKLKQCEPWKHWTARQIGARAEGAVLAAGWIRSSGTK